MKPTNEDERISRHRAKLFEDVKRRFEETSRTPLTVVVCGPGPPPKADPNDPFHLRDAIKNELTSIGDIAFYIEDWLETADGKKTIKELETRLGYRPDLRDIEFEIVQSDQTEKMYT